MKLEFKVAGISFRVKDDTAIRRHMPTGECELIHKPFVHPHTPSFSDPNSVEVWNGGIFIGYIPKTSSARASFFAMKEDGLDVKATVTDYSYAIYDGNLNIVNSTFNNECDGYLASVTIEMETAVSGTHYSIAGQGHLRTTCVAGLIDDIGFKIPQYLYDWMTMTDGLRHDYEGYCEKLEGVRSHGVKLHSACEAFMETGVVTDDTPHGLAEFVTKFQVEMINAEQIVKRGRKYRTAGRYDMLAYANCVYKGQPTERHKVIIDWKRGKTMKIAYMLQCAFYAKQTKAHEFWVVLFGTNNKCGYSVKRFGPTQIDVLDKIYRSLTKIAYDLQMFKEWKRFK